jgi:hypothetical protein
MSKRHYEVDTRILTVFFLVAVPFLAFGAIVVMNLARSHLQDVMTTYLEQRAQEARQVVERYVLGQFSHLHLLSLDPEVKAAVNGAPREATPEELRRLDQAWATGEPALVASVTGSPLAARLREIGQIQPALRLLQVMDARGRLLATTARGGRFWNGDTAWFRALSDGELGGRPYVVDIVAPPASGPMFELDVPIRDATDGRVLGAMRALYDASDLYSALATVRFGRTGHAALMRSADGMLLATDESSRVLKESFPGFEYITVARREHRVSWAMPAIKTAEVSEPPRLVGFAPIEQVPNVEWTVSVEQDLDEAVAPIKSIGWYLLIHVVGVIATTLVLALIFTSQLEAPVIEDELHLHEEHVPSDYRAAS